VCYSGITYVLGVIIRAPTTPHPPPSRHDWPTPPHPPTIDSEFQRALESIESDPPAAVTSACAILEAMCKIYIEDEKLQAPDKQDLRGVWKVVQKHLKLEPGSVEDDDLKRILQGLASIMDGISAFRTHAGSAHGRGRTGYRPLPRHARLAIHAAHTLVSFLIETWDSRKLPAVNF
jgi:hypothetical protein